MPSVYISPAQSMRHQRLALLLYCTEERRDLLQQLRSGFPCDWRSAAAGFVVQRREDVSSHTKATYATQTFQMADYTSQTTRVQHHQGPSEDHRWRHYLILCGLWHHH
jgi:hypothetical protein